MADIREIESPMLKAGDIAKVLGVSTRRVYQLHHLHRIPTSRIGPRSIRASRTAWQAWLHGLDSKALAQVKEAHHDAA